MGIRLWVVVCEREKERERGKERGKEGRERQVNIDM